MRHTHILTPMAAASACTPAAASEPGVAPQRWWAPAYLQHCLHCTLLVPTLAELREARASPEAAVRLYVRLAGAVVAACTAAGLLAVALAAVALGPSLLLILLCCGIVALAPLVVLVAVREALRWWAPAAPRWHAFVAAGCAYPFGVVIVPSMAAAAAMLVVAFPLIWAGIFGLLVAISPAGERKHFFGASANLWFMAPGILPNFVVVYLCFAPMCALTCVFWLPAAIVSWYLTALPTVAAFVFGSALLGCFGGSHSLQFTTQRGGDVAGLAGDRLGKTCRGEVDDANGAARYAVVG